MVNNGIEIGSSTRRQPEKCGNPGRGHVSYLSSTICDEFIELLGATVHEQIVLEIKKAKYFGISIDSTPDMAHIDQLTVIIRYCLSTGVVVERFFGFIEIAHHDGNYLFTTTENMLSSDGIDIRNCRSQSYDNASNMSGVYSGVQAHMRKVNDLAVWVPCAAHSLNLVGASAAECCNHAVNFFGILQSLYSFFSASPQRWSVLTEHLPPAAVHDAKSLLNKLDKLETAIMCVVWNDILQHTDRVNKSLQEAGIELCTVVQLYDSLISHFRRMRNQFDEFESTAKRYVASDCDYVEAAARIRARKRMANDGPSTEVSLAPRENFIVSTFYVIVDQLLAEMVRRRAAYADLNDKFGFLTDKQLLLRLRIVLQLLYSHMQQT